MGWHWAFQANSGGDAARGRSAGLPAVGDYPMPIPAAIGVFSTQLLDEQGHFAAGTRPDRVGRCGARQRRTCGLGHVPTHVSIMAAEGSAPDQGPSPWSALASCSVAVASLPASGTVFDWVVLGLVAVASALGGWVFAHRGASSPRVANANPARSPAPREQSQAARPPAVPGGQDAVAQAAVAPASASFAPGAGNADLEGRVRERTLQLEAANQELEAFSYSVSHDLRAPLRSIRGFSEILLERHAAQLDSRGQELLQRVCESCAHMDRLIEDLLKLSRVSRGELLRQPVDLTRMAEAILAELRKGEPGRQVQTNLQAGLTAYGDERLLQVALDNLLGNSWKFTRKTAEARIEFGYTREQGGAFFVRDNGAGFDPAFAQRLFAVFQRLHPASEFPGTGVGLATVQRILRRHGGSAWATGAVNQGACFFFTLPGGGSSTQNLVETDRVSGQKVAARPAALAL